MHVEGFDDKDNDKKIELKSPLLFSQAAPWFTSRPPKR